MTCKCIATIRRHGLKHRIGDVEEFQRSINAQCMAMAASRRKPGGKKQTKSVLRRMKRICKTVLEHGKRYRQLLEAQGIFDGLCPRNPRDVEQRFESDEVFVVAQRRRAQSEGRIGILKNAFLDGVPRAKGFKNRSLQVSCAVLAYNFWVEMGSGTKGTAARSCLSRLAAANQGAKRRNSQWRCVQKFGNGA
jgi:hypothetical protein